MGKYLSSRINPSPKFFALTSCFILQVWWAWSPTWPFWIWCWVFHVEPRLSTVWRGG